MRPLWPIERAVLEATAQDFPTFADGLRQQAASAQVTKFENSGAGFFSTIAVEPEAPLIANRRWLDGAYGDVADIENGMGFIVFFEDGRISLIEGYCHGDVSTVGIDFSEVTFDLRPWSKAQR